MFIFDKKIHPYNVAISLPPVNHFSYILADTAGNLQQKSIMVSPPNTVCITNMSGIAMLMKAVPGMEILAVRLFTVRFNVFARWLQHLWEYEGLGQCRVESCKICVARWHFLFTSAVGCII